MDSVNGLMLLAGAFGVLAILFLLGREVLLWYWRVNRIVSLLESIDRKLDARPAERPATTAHTGATARTVGSVPTVGPPLRVRP